ncbi:MAG TPA: NAD(P)-dependent oxidoreductase [Sphingomicrobium sp.]
MKRTPRALVIGASETAALLHLPVLAKLRSAGQLELVEICDLRLDRAMAEGERFGFARNCGDAGAAIARSDIDIVYLFGGARMHHALGLAALKAGKHLFVEKPIAPSHSEALELADVANARGLIAAGGHNRRFLAGFKRIQAGAGCAAWSFAEAIFHKPEFGRSPPFGAATWLTGNGIHALDALLFMMGSPPEWVTANVGGGHRSPAVFTAMMRWPNDSHAVLLCNNEGGGRREEYAFHAPGETWRITEGGLTIEKDGTHCFADLPAAGDGFAAEHEAFLDAVKTGLQPCHAIAALAPSLFLAELIEAGHHGPVRPPVRRVAPVTASDFHPVVVANADRLRSAIGDMPANWAPVSLEDVQRSPRPRPEIRAAILGQGSAPLSDETLDKLPNLQIAGVVGLSLKRYGVERLLDRGITLVNASRAYAESVAEFALGLAILGRRRAFASNQAMRLGSWGITLPQIGALGWILRMARLAQPIAVTLGIEPRLRRAWHANSKFARLSSPAMPARDLGGALIGLIGWGSNASALTSRLVAAGASVIVHSDHASAEEIRSGGAEPAPLASVLAAEIVSLHRGLTPATRHCLGATELERLRPGAVLINVARGALIDPDALVARLRRGDIVACLDTFEEEPLPRRHPLRRMKNVFLTSHIAGGSPDMDAAAAREVIGKIARHLDGGTVETVTEERLAVMT